MQSITRAIYLVNASFFSRCARCLIALLLPRGAACMSLRSGSTSKERPRENELAFLFFYSPSPSLFFFFLFSNLLLIKQRQNRHDRAPRAPRGPGDAGARRRRSTSSSRSCCCFDVCCVGAAPGGAGCLRRVRLRVARCLALVLGAKERGDLQGTRAQNITQGRVRKALGQGAGAPGGLGQSLQMQQD